VTSKPADAGPGAIAQHRCRFVLQRRDARVEVSNHGIELVKRCSDVDWPLTEGVALVTGLLPHGQQTIAHQQPLLEFVIDLLRRHPAGRLAFCRELREHLVLQL
jgi:hypothetical protein